MSTDSWKRTKSPKRKVSRHAQSAARPISYLRRRGRQKEASVVVSEKVVRRLMKEEDIHVPSYNSPKKYSSYIGEVSPPVENLLKRDFHVDALNEKWLSDITEFHIPAGKVYLFPLHHRLLRRDSCFLDLNSTICDYRLKDYG